MKQPSITRTEDQATVAFDTDLTSSTVLDVRPQLQALIGAGVRLIVFDFSQTIFVDSSGIGMLMSAQQALGKVGGRIEVVGARPEVLSLFRAMRLDRRFKIAGTEAGPGGAQ